MMRRVDGEESILGTELVEPKSVPLGTGGRCGGCGRVDVENVSNGYAVERAGA
jgi:hypothetical protein